MRRRNFIAAALASAFASSLSRRRDPPGDRSRDGSRASHDTQIRSRRELPRTRCAPTEREPADPYLAHIERRMAEGCENAMALWREVRDQGFAGSHRQVHRFVAERRTAPARRTAQVARTRYDPSPLAEHAVAATLAQAARVAPGAARRGLAAPRSRRRRPGQGGWRSGT